MEEKNLTKFKIGDSVRHRASGEFGIIREVHETCTIHQHPFALCSMKFDKSQCDFQPSGFYDISFGFGRMIVLVDGALLERAENVCAPQDRGNPMKTTVELGNGLKPEQIDQLVDIFRNFLIEHQGCKLECSVERNYQDLSFGIPQLSREWYTGEAVLKVETKGWLIEKKS